jgi:cold shock CspA family protein
VKDSKLAVESDSLEQQYRAIHQALPPADLLYTCLALRDWFNSVAEFDERSGECLPVQLSRVVQAVSQYTPLSYPKIPNDRFGRVAQHVQKSLQQLLRSLNPRLLREHAIVPIHAAREFDSSCISWLSRRNGRTIREKLSGRPYVKAVHRVESLDTPENRLFKSFCKRFADYTRLRDECFSLDAESQTLLRSITDWLHSDTASDIGTWENFAPNNSLLQHRDYRRIWDGWQRLQAIDETSKTDYGQFNHNWSVSLFWESIYLLQKHFQVRWFEQPCDFEYESFTISPAMSLPDTIASISGLIVTTLDRSVETGIVRKPTNEKGFGFVETESNESIFFHANGFASTNAFASVGVGTKLKFRIVETPKGKAAVDLSILGSPFVEVHLRLKRDLSLELFVGDSSINAKCVEVSKDLSHLGLFINGLQSKLQLSPSSSRKAAEIPLLAVIPSVSDSMNIPVRVESDVKRIDPDRAVVDLTRLRPEIAKGDARLKLQRRLLWQEWRIADSTRLGVELGNSSGIVLGDDIPTVSVLSLYSSISEYPLGTLNDAAAYFARSIKAELNEDRVTYLIPDSVDDFTLNTLRRNMNGTFLEAEPLPASVAAVFDWQSSEDFAKHQVRDGDVVVVFASIGAEACFTCLRARADRERFLAKRIPESNGMYWERHPTQVIDIGTSSFDEAARILKKSGCAFPEPIAKLCGVESLFDGTLDGLGWMNQNGGMYSYLSSWPNGRIAPSKYSTDEALCRAEVLDFLKRIIGRGRCFALAVGDTFHSETTRQPSRHSAANASVVGYKVDVVRGGAIHDRWQLGAGEIPIWREHLPDLSMRVIADGRYMPFHLVQSETVVPRRSETSSIVIDDVFTLQPGMTTYEFPLVMGSGQQNSQFVATLQSKAFPLRESVPCRLEMTFTYGADNPYRLRFVPTNSKSAGFTEVVVRWKQKSLSQSPSLYPDFPSPMTWGDLSAYRTNAGNTIDLIRLFEDQVTLLESTGEFLRCARTGEVTSHQLRQCGTVERLSSGVDRNGYDYVAGRVVDSRGRSYVIHTYGFENRNDSFGIREKDLISFDVGPNDRAKRITLGVSVPPAIANRIRDQFIQCAGRVWNGGKSSDSSDSPLGFCNVAERAIAAAHELVSESQLRHEIDANSLWLDIENCLALYLCCFHKDAPNSVYDALLEVFTKGDSHAGVLESIVRHMGFVLGAGHDPRQKQLIDRTYNVLQAGAPADVSAALEWLGIAIWRHPELLWNLPDYSHELVFQKLAIALESDIRDLQSLPARASRGKDFKSHVAIEPVRNHLELLLAFLRLREGGEEAVHILSPESKLARSFTHIIEKLDDLLIRIELPLRSRIKLQLEKPDSLNRTPDLLYGLRLYLTGDTAASAIHVLGVDDDEM